MSMSGWEIGAAGACWHLLDPNTSHQHQSAIRRFVLSFLRSDPNQFVKSVRFIELRQVFRLLVGSDIYAAQLAHDFTVVWCDLCPSALVHLDLLLADFAAVHLVKFQ